MKLKLIIALLFTVITIEVKAQDPIFTQFYLIPESLNPAFTGMSNAWSAGLIHRRQWPDGNRKIDTQFAFANNMISDEIGIGITLVNHNEVFTNYNFFQFNSVFSYIVELDDDWRLRLGMETGYGRKDYNFNNLLLEDQININNGSISNSSIDPGVLGYRDKIDFFNVTAGFEIDQENAWIGVALKHLNRPNISFTQNGNTPIDMFLTIHGGYYFEFLNSPTSLIPEDTNLMLTANYMRQSQYSRLDIGAVMDFNQFSFGLIASTNPERRSSNSHLLTSVNPVVTFKFGEFKFGYSYDSNTSRLGRTQGVHEISLTWLSSRICIPCPDNYKVKLKHGPYGGYNRT
jgi:type IX secretion system PorP/SprF family membrane protein